MNKQISVISAFLFLSFACGSLEQNSAQLNKSCYDSPIINACNINYYLYRSKGNYRIVRTCRPGAINELPPETQIVIDEGTCVPTLVSSSPSGY